MPRPKKNYNTTTVHVNVNDSVLDIFDRMYPSCRTRFINNAMALANNDRNLFDKIFFKDIIKDDDMRLYPL